MHPIAAGDMYGIRGIDHLARPGLLRTVIAGSYPSGPSRAEPPLIWQMIERDEVRRTTCPRACCSRCTGPVRAGQPGVFTRVGIDTFVDPRQQGGRMNAATNDDLVEVTSVRGSEWLFYPAVEPDVAIIRATTADAQGNLTFEDEGSVLGALDQAYAAHNHGGIVIAQVKRLADGRQPAPAARARAGHPRRRRRRRTRASCRPRPPPTTRRSAETSADRSTSSSPRPGAWRRSSPAARHTSSHHGDIVNLGFGISALVPRILVEEGQGDEVTWVIEQGAVGGVPLTGFAFGCALNPQALMPSIDQFTLLQGGGFDRAMLSFLEIDDEGNVNVHHLPGRRHVTAGVGGFADITSRGRLAGLQRLLHRRTPRHRSRGRPACVIRTDGTVPKFVERVAEVTFSGRRALAAGPARPLRHRALRARAASPRA